MGAQGGPTLSPQVSRHRTPRGSIEVIPGLVVFPPVSTRSPGGSTHVPVGYGSLQVPGPSGKVPMLNSNVQVSPEVCRVPSSLSRQISRSAVAPSLTRSMPHPPPFENATIRNTANDLTDLGSLDTQKQAYLQQIDDCLTHSVQTLREQNAAQKCLLKWQSENIKRAYASKIDHEVKVEEVNLDRQANHELLRLRQIASHHKAMLEQQAGTAVYDYQKLKSVEGLLKEVCSGFEQCAEATLAYPPAPPVSPVSLYKEYVVLPRVPAPRLVPPRMHAMSTIESESTPSHTPTTLAASPLMSSASSFVPWPKGSYDLNMLSMHPGTEVDTEDWGTVSTAFGRDPIAAVVRCAQ